MDPKERGSLEEQLRQEVARISVDEILALCYAFQHSTERLHLYMDVLRKQSGGRAQFAACLICFDLARQGQATFQAEFSILADTMRQLAQDSNMVETLLNEDPYLSLLWEICDAQLEELDPRFEPDTAVLGGSEEIASLELLSDDDFDDFALGGELDDTAVWAQLDRAIEAFLGGKPGLPAYDASCGFRLKNSRDAKRLEAFINELDSLHGLIPMARAYRVLALLFYGTHMRSRGLFNRANEQKRQIIRDGLEAFIEDAPGVWEIAGVFSPNHAPADVWPKISELLLDYVQWLAESPEAEAGPMAYDALRNGR